MISQGLREALEEAFGERAAFDAPLSKHTSLRVGGPADALVTPGSADALPRLLELCRRHDAPVHWLGAGFNTLVRDGGLPGVVVSLRKLRSVEALGEGRVRAEAGVSHSQLVRFCADRALAGLEFAVGIPGTVGGWIAMNAGIGTREMKDVVEEVELARPYGTQARISAADLGFRYRGLDGLPPGAAITAATFALTPGDESEIRSEMRRHLDHRAATQPIDVPSCGSVFVNPPGDFAGRLVEAAGLKGTRVGGAEISTIHANFIVNRGGATAADVLELIERARQSVRERFDVALETEVRIIGRSIGGRA